METTTETRTSSSTATGTATSTGRWKRVGAAVFGGALVLLGLGRRSVGGVAVALVGAWLSYRAVGRRGDGSDRDAEPVAVERSVTVARPPEELSEFLRDHENLDRIAGPVVDVSSTGGDRHQWSVHGPLDRRLVREARLVEDDPGERIAWRSDDGGWTSTDWAVDLRDAPEDRGTEVTARVRIDPPGGAVGTAATERLAVLLESGLGKALDRLKSLAETGSVPTLEANPSARGAGDLV